ncbi:hypothetical protein V8C26DRAFT_222840 [Trichoderma gracile]
MSLHHITVGTASAQAQSPLMRLPQELRSSIYSLLFSSTRFTSGRRLMSDWTVRDISPAPQGLAILLCCRRAYSEIGKTWISQVLFCFETPTAMLKKLANISLETRSLVRHVRVSGHYMKVTYNNKVTELYMTHQVLKLLPGLKLDKLTVFGHAHTPYSYDTLDLLVEHSDGWKELHYISHDLHYISHRHVESAIGEPDEIDDWGREQQPTGWRRKLEARDEADSGASVTLFKWISSNQPSAERHTDTWVKLTETLPSVEYIQKYLNTNVGSLTAMSASETRMLVVVKRGNGVDHEEKQHEMPPHYALWDLGQETPPKTWAEIMAHRDSITCFSSDSTMYYATADSEQPEPAFLVDEYENVDDYVWPVYYMQDG